MSTTAKRTALRLIPLILLALCPAAAAAEEGSSPPTGLPESEIKYLQDAEHLGGFVLGDIAFPLIKATIAESDAKGFAAFLAPGFEARVFDPKSGEETKTPFGTFRVRREGKDPLVPRSRDAFVADLMDFRATFKELKISGVKVIRMSPVKHGDLAGAWQGTLKIFLGGRTRDGKVAYRSTQYRARIQGIDEDTPKKRGWILGLETYLDEESSSADFLMEDMTAQTGIDVKMLQDNWVSCDPKNIPFLTGGAYLADYDQDGLMDMLLTDLNGLRMYRGQPGGRFTDVTASSGLPPGSHVLGGVFADLDGDGYEDLLLGNQPYKNEGGKRFRALPRGEHRLFLSPGAFKYAVADYDRDGKLDLYVVGLKYPGSAESQRTWIGKNRIGYNELWHNLGNWRFENVTQKSGTGGSGSSVFAAVWFDANGDDWPDIMTANEFGTDDYYLNQKDGTFKTGEMPAGYGGFSMGITVSDIDNDGLGDPYVANMYSKAGERVVHNLDPSFYPKDVYDQMLDFITGDELYHNLGGKFERTGISSGINDVGWAFGTGFGDLNSDGLPDVFSPVGFQSVTRQKPDG